MASSSSSSLFFSFFRSRRTTRCWSRTPSSPRALSPWKVLFLVFVFLFLFIFVRGECAGILFLSRCCARRIATRNFARCRGQLLGLGFFFLESEGSLFVALDRRAKFRAGCASRGLVGRVNLYGYLTRVANCNLGSCTEWLCTRLIFF